MNETAMLDKSTYYILDVQGNQLSIYEHQVDTINSATLFYLTERNIYGSSRLGTTNDTLNMFMSDILPSYGILGNRTYELNNHLGNVLTVIIDVKYPVSDDNTTISGYEVGINGISDYSPFGAPLDGRTMGSFGKYGFNSQEHDNEVSGEGNSYTAEFWQYSPRLGRRWEMDPKPNFSISSYATFGNNPIMFSDLYGDTITDPKSREHFNELVKRTKEKILEYGNKIDELLSGKPTNWKMKEAQHYTMAMKDLNSALTEYDEMLHTQDYDYNIAVDMNLREGVAGETSLSKKDNYTVDIRFKGNYATLSHEMKHGYEYISGDSDGSDFTYDLGDEVFAHIRATAFDRGYYGSEGINYIWDVTPNFVRNRGDSYRNLPGISLRRDTPVTALYGYNNLKELLVNKLKPYFGLGFPSENLILNKARSLKLNIGDLNNSKKLRNEFSK